jgi:hypothetical protein
MQINDSLKQAIHQSYLKTEGNSVHWPMKGHSPTVTFLLNNVPRVSSGNFPQHGIMNAHGLGAHDGIMLHHLCRHTQHTPIHHSEATLHDRHSLAAGNSFFLTAALHTIPVCT